MGARVEIHSLRQSPELNGVRGEVVEFNAGAGCWHVKTEPDGRVRALRAANLTVIENKMNFSEQALIFILILFLLSFLTGSLFNCVVLCVFLLPLMLCCSCWDWVCCGVCGLLKF